MHHIYGDSVPSIAAQMAECDSPFVDAMLDGPLFNKSTMPAGKNAGRKQSMANAKKQKYTDEEKRAYYIGLGSTMSHSQKGREKHVRALTGNDPAQILHRTNADAPKDRSESRIISASSARRAPARRNKKTARRR